MRTVYEEEHVLLRQISHDFGFHREATQARAIICPPGRIVKTCQPDGSPVECIDGVCMASRGAGVLVKSDDASVRELVVQALDQAD